MDELNLLKMRAPYGKWHLLSKLKWRFRCLKWGVQRIKRGYSDYDLWELDSFYLNLFTNSLRDFAENLHGAPNDFYDENIKGDESKPWKDYITTMAEHFEKAKLDDFCYNDKLAKEELRKGMEMLVEHFYALWD